VGAPRLWNIFKLDDEKMSIKVALIIGAGPGISLSFAKKLIAAGYTVALASRNMEKLNPLAKSIGAHACKVNANSIEDIKSLFSFVENTWGEPEVVLFNPSSRVKGDILSLDAIKVSDAISTTALGAFVTAQEAAKRMIPKNQGTIFFTGATASVKGFAGSSGFAIGKFAVRGLAQSLARELSPLGIHVAHFVIDGAVKTDPSNDAMTADAISETYMAILNQPKAAWTWEIELRGKDEKF
jgi:NAD(P)-dependent dehydrogenase (short-subunit alcohol dehydrogenase family)